MPDFINKNMLHQWYIYIYIIYTSLFLNICNSNPSAPFFRTIASYTLKNWQWTNLAELDTLYFLQHHSHSAKQINSGNLRDHLVIYQKQKIVYKLIMQYLRTAIMWMREEDRILSPTPYHIVYKSSGPLRRSKSKTITKH